MSFKFTYDHSHLSMPVLHEAGIRSTKELEEVIEDMSVCEVNESLFDFPIYIFTGLTSKCRGLKIAVTFDHEGKYVTLDAQIADPKELVKKLCKR